jgi:hypothetical protein
MDDWEDFGVGVSIPVKNIYRRKGLWSRFEGSQHQGTQDLYRFRPQNVALVKALRHVIDFILWSV